MIIYKLRVWQWEDHYATKALAAAALGYTEAQVNAAAAANVNKGLPPYPVTASIPVGFTGRLANLRIQGAQVDAYLYEIDVAEA